MPRISTKAAASGKAALPQLSKQMLEELIPGPVTKEQFEDIFQNFKKAFIERALNAEMSHHLGYGAGQTKPEGATNHRNGSSAKTVITDTGSVRIEVPREREGTFEPQLIGKHERRLTGFDDKIIALPVSFWGDLDWSGMRILAAMRNNFPGMRAWEPGYQPMLQSLMAGQGHSPEASDKKGQRPMVVFGCPYADAHLVPALTALGRFVDQEQFTL
jgi:hypothetical protein